MVGVVERVLFGVLVRAVPGQPGCAAVQALLFATCSAQRRSRVRRIRQEGTRVRQRLHIKSAVGRRLHLGVVRQAPLDKERQRVDRRRHAIDALPSESVQSESLGNRPSGTIIMWRIVGIL
jgi:hypothetical protein